ncbi:putative SOS response-associated peptidase YedK [Paenibacillus mucilaginosus]|uniref:SOS response-associated peptidase n=1 Tax=Paenibacillus mucilaginosus TaxID=61624 RepID=UPI003D1C4549
MCERFSLSSPLQEVSERFGIRQVRFAYTPRFNIAPTQPVSVIVPHKGERMLEEHRWGLVPFWGKDAVNADSSAVHEKPAYRKLFAQQRCIIPSNGFYVWKTVKKKREPLRVVLKEGGLFGMAGLYEIWKDTRGKEYRTCTVMMTRANRLVFEYDERMPVILDDAAMDDWLDPLRNGQTDFLQSLLQPYAPERMRAYAVSPEVAGREELGAEDVEPVPGRMAWMKR